MKNTRPFAAPARKTRGESSPLRGLKKAMLYGGLLACMAQGMAMPDAAAQSEEAMKLYNQGIRAYQEKDTAEALRRFTRATQVDPMYADAYYNMGSIHYQQARYEDARAAFQSALALSPNDSQARYNLGQSLEKLKRYDEAINVLIMIPPNDPKYKDAKVKIDEMRRIATANTTAPKTAATTPAAQKPAASAPAASTAKKGVPVTFATGFDGPTGMAIGPGGFMYVANYSKNMIYKVGAEGQKTVFVQEKGLSGPIGVVYNPKTNELYVSNYLAGSVSRINGNGQIFTLASGLKKPYNLFLDTVNNALFISEQETNSVSRIALP